MRDVCVACGRPIYTVHLHYITLAQRWTHGKRRWDKNHAPIPANHDYRVVNR